MQIRAAVILGGAALFGVFLACNGSPELMRDGGPAVTDAGQAIPDAGNVIPLDSGEGLPIDSACAAINGARCTYLQRCGLLPPGADTLRACEDYFTATDCGPARWPSRVKQGTLRYFGDASLECQQAWTEQSCANWQQVPEPCGSVTAPAALLGGACFGGSHNECTEGVCTGGTCPRHCRMPGEVEDLCEADPDCRVGLYCQRNVSGGALGTCTTYGLDGDSCASGRPCAPGYYCGDSSLCRMGHKVGEACDPGTCELNAWCAWGPEGGVCASSLSVGEKCSDDAQCRSDLLCLRESGTCQPKGPLGNGAACSRRQSCGPGLACVGTQPSPLDPPVLGKCQAPVQAEGACTSSFDCAEPLACVPGSDGRVCGVREDNGAACTSDRDCQLFSRCVNASCTALPARGEPCPSGACLWGSCEQTPDAGPVCRSGLSANAACSLDAECASQRCSNGICLAACTP